MTQPEPPPTPQSNGEVRWGILATGGVARLFTRDLLAHGHRVTAVGSRSADAARAFADSFDIPRAHETYEELVADPDVDVIYVATPHNLHASNALAAIDQGKHVLIEKAFTLNAAQAREVTELARSRGVLVMEAMWTRFLPHMAYIRRILARGQLGEIRSLHAVHTQRLPFGPTHRLNAPQLAGGALLDLGIYPLSFAHDILGPPVEVMASATFKSTGVDASIATILRHENGAVSTSYSSMETRGSNTAAILGTEGRIEIPSIWYGPVPVTVHDAKGAVIERFDQPVSGRGMQYQAAEVEWLLAAGEIASPLITPEDSVAVMTTMDAIRSAIGLRYPDE